MTMTPAKPSACVDQAAFSELQATAGADFVNELIDTFLEEVPVMLSELRDAHAQRRLEPFRRAARQHRAERPRSRICRGARRFVDVEGGQA
jgi:hypothetical protein